MKKKTAFFLLFIFLIVAGFGYFVYMAGKFMAKLYVKAPTITSNTLIEVKFNREVLERKPLVPFKKTIAFHEIIKALYNIPADKNIKAVMVMGNQLPLDTAQLEELRKALEFIVKKGKKVYVYYDQIGMNYFLVPKGAEVIMHPTLGKYVSLRGYYTAQAFFRTLLEDRLGIKFNVIHIGKYKGAGEPFVRDSMSEYLRKELTEYFDSLWNNIIDYICEAKGFDKKTFSKNLFEGKYFALSKKEALKIGLIDRLAVKKDIEDKYDNVVKITDYVRTLSPSFGTKPIALIIAEGEIVMGEEEPELFGSNKNIIASDTMCDIIRRAADNNSVKAIVLRINSPGGSALASELINRELKRAAAKKPVIISVGRMAASGGYYISCAGDYIIADKNSLVGSIGVVSMIPEITGLTKKIGINFEPVKKGKYSDFLSPFKKASPDEEQVLKDMMLDIYKLFKQRVAEGRNLKLDYVESVAQGRFYSASKGVELKLVDKIGTLHDALEEAKKRANLDSTEYTVFSSKKTFLEMLKDFETKTSINMGELLKQEYERILKISNKPLVYQPALADISF